MRYITPVRLLVTVVSLILLIIGLAPVATNAQGFLIDWSNPEVLFTFPENNKSNQLWVLKDHADFLYLWWPITVTEGEEAVTDDSNSRTLHTQRMNEEWRSPIDVLMWPDAGRLTSVVIDQEGILHGFSGTDCVSYVSAQHDEAMSARGWQKRICLDQTGLANPSAGQTKDGIIYVMYAALENHSLRLIHSDNGGATWSSYITIVEDIENFLRYPVLAIDNLGRIHAAWSVSQAPDGYPPLGVYYSRSDNGGVNWTAPIQLGGIDEGEPAIAVFDDEVHILWNGDAEKRGRYYRYSKNAGETWDPVEILSPPSSQGGRGGLQRPPAIIVDNLGNVHALLHEQESLFYISKINQNWTEKVPLYSPAVLRASEVFAVRLAITGGNQLHAFYLLASFNQLNTDDILDRSWTLFHQSKQIDAVAVPPTPWPTETPSSDPDNEIQIESDPIVTENTQDINFTYDGIGMETYNPARGIYIGATSVSVFIVVLLMLFFIRQRR